jgi:diaminobutyrate-2-oxoglutarate transaminase
MAAATDETETLTHTLDFPTEARIEFMEAVDEIAPGDLAGNARMAFGGPTGSDAIEASMKLAMAATGGDGFVAFRGGNHGQTAGALSLSSVNKYKRHLPRLPNVAHVGYPYPGDDVDAAVTTALDELETVLSDPYGGLTDPAGIWVEPMQGSGGVVVPPEEFVVGLRDLADAHDVPLIFDEIQTGVGRTGEWFAADWYDVTPDAVVLGKSIGGTLPLSLTLFHESLDVWDPGAHKGTFRGFTPAMRAGTRAIEYIREHELLDHARSLGKRLRSRLRDGTEDVSAVCDVRGTGLLLGIEFVDGSGEPDPETAAAVRDACFERGVVILTAGRYGNVLRGLPPLVLTRAQADAGADLIVDAISAAT